MKILVIIPARGGSKGIPRKNLRSLNGKPLIYYVIKTALSSRFKPAVFVSSDDSEILMLAKRFGAGVHFRNKQLAHDMTTLDPVVHNALSDIEESTGRHYDIVVTIQPTSPLLTVQSLDDALEQMIHGNAIDTIISSRERAHLSWHKDEEGRFIPNYAKRVNRQDLPVEYDETGAFVITRTSQFKVSGTRFNGRIELAIVSDDESIDIDTFHDWALVEYFMKRKTILFVLTGNATVGMGHVYRCLLLANQILDHNILFLVDKDSELAFDKIKEYHYSTYLQTGERLQDDVMQLNPDVVVNDILDTMKEYMLDIKKFGIRTINLEDLGEGSNHSDIVINALYPEKVVKRNHYYGHQYFCARDEFVHTPKQKIRKTVQQVLISYGGVDPNNLTLKTLESIHDYCYKNKIGITAILGRGYARPSIIQEKFIDVEISQDVTNISEYMSRADVIFTSAGRTVYEVACIGTPSIVIAQNKRELSHFFASPCHGFINLGLGVDISEDEILETFIRLCSNHEERSFMHELMIEVDLRKGRERVVSLIKNMIEVSDEV